MLLLYLYVCFSQQCRTSQWADISKVTVKELSKNKSNSTETKSSNYRKKKTQVGVQRYTDCAFHRDICKWKIRCYR